MKGPDELMLKLTRVLELLEKLLGEPKPWEPWMDTFLDDLERHGGNVTAAIELNEKSRGTIYNRRRQNKEFGQHWSEICRGKDNHQ